jgi:hypothetical protein
LSSRSFFAFFGGAGFFFSGTRRNGLPSGSLRREIILLLPYSTSFTPDGATVNLTTLGVAFDLTAFGHFRTSKLT